jgi:hypothetical protein
VGQDSTHFTGHFVDHNVYFMLEPNGTRVIPPTAEASSILNQVSCQVAKTGDLLTVTYQDFPNRKDNCQLILPATITPTRF